MLVHPDTIAAARRAKAGVCDHTALIHGLNTPHGANYAREARYWWAAAKLAESGDRTPRPAIHQTEERACGRVWALVYRAHPLTGIAECVDVETFADFTTAHEWGRLRAAELNAQPRTNHVTAA